jgi:hypothetical protein
MCEIESSGPQSMVLAPEIPPSPGNLLNRIPSESETLEWGPVICILMSLPRDILIFMIH